MKSDIQNALKPFRCLLPLVGVIVVLSLPEVFREIFAEGTTPIIGGAIKWLQAKHNSSLSEVKYYGDLGYEGGLTWITCMTVYAILCVVAAGVYSFNLFRAACEASDKTKATFLLLSAILMVSAFTITYHWRTFHDSTGLWDQLIHETVAKTLPHFRSRYLYFDAFGIAVSLLFPIATGSLLLLKDKQRVDGIIIGLRIKRLKMLLYLSSFLLVAAVIRLSALFQWAEEYFAPIAGDPKTAFVANAIDGMTNSMVAAMGVYYTLILLAAYLPVSLILQGYSREIVKTVGFDSLNAETKAILSTPVSRFEDFTKLAAFLSPLLAGPIGSALGHLK